jgi:hypothetical protein
LILSVSKFQISINEISDEPRRKFPRFLVVFDIETDLFCHLSAMGKPTVVW